MQSNNTPIDADWKVKIELIGKWIDKIVTVHTQQSWPVGIFAFRNDGNVRTIGPCCLISWEIVDCEIITIVGQFNLDVIEISPSVSVLSLNDKMVFVSSVHGLIPITFIGRMVGVEEWSSSRVFDVKLENLRGP